MATAQAAAAAGRRRRGWPAASPAAHGCAARSARPPASMAAPPGSRACLGALGPRDQGTHHEAAAARQRARAFRKTAQRLGRGVRMQQARHRLGRRRVLHERIQRGLVLGGIVSVVPLAADGFAQAVMLGLQRCGGRGVRGLRRRSGPRTVALPLAQGRTQRAIAGAPALARLGHDEYIDRRNGSSDVAAPALPVQPAAMVLQPAGRQAVQVQHIDCIAATMASSGVAPMQTPVGQDGLARDDVARDQRRTKLRERLGGAEGRGTALTIIVAGPRTQRPARALLVAGLAVLPAPQLAAGGRDLEVQALAVGQAHVGLALGAAGVAAHQIGQRHGGISRRRDAPGRGKCPHLDTPHAPKNAPDRDRLSMDAPRRPKKKALISQGFSLVRRIVLDHPGSHLAEGGGFEPPSGVNLNTLSRRAT